MRSIYFDLDDTLIYTQYKFNDAALDCIKVINRNLGYSCPHPKAVLDYFIELELSNAEKYGFQKIRFANSWVETYKFFAERLDMEIDPELSNQIFEIANQVNEPPFIVCPEVEEALRQASKEIEEMFIFTMGDPKVQQAKIDALPGNVRNFFKDFYIVPKKTVEAFKEVLGERNPKECIMVGNSVRSDILPAIGTGVYVIHVPAETWMYESHSDPYYYNRLYTIPSIKHLPNILKAIQE